MRFLLLFGGLCSVASSDPDWSKCTWDYTYGASIVVAFSVADGAVFSRNEAEGAHGQCLDSSIHQQDVWIRHTAWAKLRVDSTTLRIDANDQTYATRVAGNENLRLGYSSDCKGSHSTLGEAVIDLHGTPFVIANIPLGGKCECTGYEGGVCSCGQWTADGWNSAMTLDCTVDQQKCTVRCGGAVGSCSLAAGYLQLAYLPKYSIEDVHKQCAETCETCSTCIGRLGKCNGLLEAACTSDEATWCGESASTTTQVYPEECAHKIRIETSNTSTGCSWDVQELEFYDANNNKLPTSNPTSSNYDHDGHVPANAFDNNCNTLWGGRRSGWDRSAPVSACYTAPGTWWLEASISDGTVSRVVVKQPIAHKAREIRVLGYRPSESRYVPIGAVSNGSDDEGSNTLVGLTACQPITTTTTATTQRATEAVATTDKPNIAGDLDGDAINATTGDAGAPSAPSPVGAIAGAVVGVAVLILIGMLIRRRANTPRLPAGERRYHQPAVVQNASFEPPRNGLVLDMADHHADVSSTIAALTQHGQSAEYAEPSARQSQLYDTGQVPGAAEHGRSASSNAEYAEPSARQSEFYDAGQVPGAADHSHTDADYSLVGEDRAVYEGMVMAPSTPSTYA